MKQKFNPFTGNFDFTGDEIFIEKTYAELSDLITNSNLVPGTLYKITDKGDKGIILKAISSNSLAKRGTRIMLCPAYYGEGENNGNTWLGVWNDQLTPAIGNLTIWGGLVWKNLTGVVGASEDDNLLDAVNWELVSKSNFQNGEYIEMIFDVDYDFENDWIEKQMDKTGNVIGVSFIANENDPGYSYNPADLTDWNLESYEGNIFSNNQAHGIFNNPFCNYIEGNKIHYLIANNTCQESISHNIGFGYSEISNNSNSGLIGSNIFTDSISNNSNSGNITYNTGLWYITNNSNNGNIQFCSNILSVSDYNNSVKDISLNSVNEYTYDLLSSYYIQYKALVPGATYKIIDKGDKGIILKAISSNQFAKRGTRIMLCPTTYETTVDGNGNTWLGIWNDQLTPAIGNLTIWGGLVWKNLTGTVGNYEDDNLLDAVNWELVSKDNFQNGEYIEMIFDVDYDFENDWIEKQIDKTGNVIGISFIANENDPGYSYNPVNLTDWNLESCEGNIFSNNQAHGIFNNPFCNYIEGNKIHYLIANNTCQESISHNIGFGYSEISNNSNSGLIESNIFTDAIMGNSNNGHIQYNTGILYITNNANNGDIQYCNNGNGVYDHDNTYGDLTYNYLTALAKTKQVLAGTEIDFAASDILTKTITEDTVFTVVNPEIKKITLVLTGQFNVTWPGSFVELSGSAAYDGTKQNYVEIECIDDVTPVFLYTIKQAA